MGGVGIVFLNLPKAPSPSEHRLMLDSVPEVAAQIGVLMSAFAIIELSPPAILAQLTGIDLSHADIILGHNRSFAARLEILEAVAISQPLEDARREPALSLISKIRESSRIRNKYAHGIWQGVSSDDKSVELHVIGWAADAKRHTSRSVVSVETITEDCAQLRETVYDVTNYGNLRVPFPDPWRESF